VLQWFYALLEVPRDVLTWIVLGLTVWLAIGVLTARLFGAFISGPEQDDQDLRRAAASISTTRRARSFVAGSVKFRSPEEE